MWGLNRTQVCLLKRPQLIPVEQPHVKKVPAPDDHILPKRALNNEDKSVDADDFLDNTHTSSMSSSYLDASAGCSLYIKRRGRLPDLLYLHVAERCIL